MERHGTQRSLARLAAVGVAASFALFGGAPAASQHQPGGGGHEEETGYVALSALYQVDLGGMPSRLTQTDAAIEYLQWIDAAPDVDAAGNIVFSSTMPAPSDGSTDAELYLLQTDGTLVQLTDNTTVVSDETGLEEPVNELNPSFSPDATEVAYEAPPQPGEGDPGGLAGAQIWVLDVATKTTERITAVPASEGAAKQPTWSPDANQLAFTLGDGRRSHIVRLDLDTDVRTDVTIENSHDSHASWHPTDPDLVAFTHRAGINADVFVKNLSTGTLSPLAETTMLAESRPAWSPDGGLIAYQQGDESLGAAIWTMDADGSDKNAATTPGLWSDRNPAFADADTIVYESTEGAPPVADLAITKTGDPAAVRAGRKVTYTIPVVNNGVLTAPEVEVVDRLPAGMTYVDAEVVFAVSEHGEEDALAEASIEVEGNVVTAGLGDLAKSERGAPVATITIVAKAGLRPGSFTNTAVVLLNAAAGDDIVDPVEANNTASATTTVLRAPIVGTAGDDVLVGTPGPDVIKGLGGDDVIHGLGDDDRLVGGAGADLLRGGDGRDVLVGKNGDDRLFGGAGRDLLKGRGGADVLQGGDDRDRLEAGRGDDKVLARDGHRDSVHGGSGRDVTRIDRGLDRVFGIEIVR